MAATTVLLLSDGRPGHFRQSEAIVLALSRRTETKVERLELVNPRVFPRRLARYAAKVLPPALVLSWLYGIAAAPKGDLIVSAGGNTLAANVALAKLTGAKNVFAGTPRHVGGGAFSLVLTPYKSGGREPNTVYALKPCALDPDTLPRPKRWPDKPFSVALLVGGPTPQADFGPADWRTLSALMRAMAADLGVRFVVVSSRRTPDAFYAGLSTVLADKNVVARFVDHRASGSGSIAEGYAADAVLVTSDSMSMISEGVAARRPVVALAPEATRPFRDDEAVASLAADGRLALVPLRQATPAAVAAQFETLTPMRENHLDALARIVLAAVDARPR